MSEGRWEVWRASWGRGWVRESTHRYRWVARFVAHERKSRGWFDREVRERT